jgi:hypothetical protein
VIARQSSYGLFPAWPIACAALLAACAAGNPAGSDAGADASDVPVADADPGSPDAPPSLPDADPGDPDACSPAFFDLLADGDFEAGDPAWTQLFNGAQPVIRSNLPYPAESGAQAALFMGFNNAMQTLRQTVTVPADATALRLRGFRCLVTEETTMVTPFDTLAIELRVPDGGPLIEELAQISNLDAAAVCDWDPFEHLAGDALAGETVELVFTATSDGASLTSMGYDTLALEAMGCPP